MSRVGILAFTESNTLGTDSQQTISKNSSECWLLIGHKKFFVSLCPIGEQFLLSSFREFVHHGYCLDHDLSGSTGGHFVCACVNTVCWSAREEFSVNFYGHRQHLQAVFWSWMTYIGCYVPQTCSLRYRWKWIYCSLAVALERSVFPFVKQLIEDKMAAECC